MKWKKIDDIKKNGSIFWGIVFFFFFLNLQSLVKYNKTVVQIILNVPTAIKLNNVLCWKRLTCRPAGQHRLCFLSWLPLGLSQSPPGALYWGTAPSHTPGKGLGLSVGGFWPSGHWLGSERKSLLAHGWSCHLHQQPEDHDRRKVALLITKQNKKKTNSQSNYAMDP